MKVNLAQQKSNICNVAIWCEVSCASTLGHIMCEVCCVFTL